MSETNVPVIRISLSGEKGRGKDTVADYIRSKYPHVQRAAFADALKRDVAHMARQFAPAGTSEEVIEPILGDRAVMGPGWQWWGEFVRQIDVDWWVKLISYEIKPTGSYIITDCRHHNELQIVKQLGFYAIRIEGPDRRNILDRRSTTHPSEIHVKDLAVDSVIANTGDLQFLFYQVDDVLRSVLEVKA